jgi:hypothetical protein
LILFILNWKIYRSTKIDTISFRSSSQITFIIISFVILTKKMNISCQKMKILKEIRFSANFLSENVILIQLKLNYPLHPFRDFHGWKQFKQFIFEKWINLFILTMIKQKWRKLWSIGWKIKRSISNSILNLIISHSV